MNKRKVEISRVPKRHIVQVETNGSSTPNPCSKRRPVLACISDRDRDGPQIMNFDSELTRLVSDILSRPVVVKCWRLLQYDESLKPVNFV